MSFNPDWVSEMLNQSNESSLAEKNSFAEGLYMMKVVIQNSAIKDYLEFHFKSYKDLEMLILSTPIALLPRGIFQWPYVRLKIHCLGREEYMNGKNFLLRMI